MRVVIYGSRAKGNFREGSDIDLTFEGDAIDLPLMLKIENELDDLLLPYQLDLSVLAHIDDTGLRDHIARVGQVLYQRAPVTDRGRQEPPQRG
ncbi:Nucleotidyltransferase domain protein [compost metagenome]